MRTPKLWDLAHQPSGIQNTKPWCPTGISCTGKLVTPRITGTISRITLILKTLNNYQQQRLVLFSRRKPMSDECASELIVTTPQRNTRYRDELNFAEFPLAALSDSVPDGQKTLVFSDTIFDRSRNAPVTRKLTITASDEYGLPTASDDE